MELTDEGNSRGVENLKGPGQKNSARGEVSGSMKGYGGYRIPDFGRRPNDGWKTEAKKAVGSAIRIPPMGIRPAMEEAGIRRKDGLTERKKKED